MRYLCSNSSFLIARVALLSSRFEYHFYVLGKIPDAKDPVVIDKKLISKYGVKQSRDSDLRNYRKGYAKVKYLRWGKTFVLLATSGESSFFSEERPIDLRVTPLLIGNYTLQVIDGKPSVQWSRRYYKQLKRYLLGNALSHQKAIEAKLGGVKHLRYGGVYRQKQAIVRRINRKRRLAGLGRINL